MKIKEFGGERRLSVHFSFSSYGYFRIRTEIKGRERKQTQ